MQREALHLPLLHAHRRGSGQTEEQGRQEAGEHRQRESNELVVIISNVYFELHIQQSAGSESNQQEWSQFDAIFELEIGKGSADLLFIP